MIDLLEWAAKWNVPREALIELASVPAYVPAGTEGKSVTSERQVQDAVRLEAAHKRVYLWRNNVGCLYSSRGEFIRYGLANDSTKVNAIIKSGDLIGIRPVLVTDAHVGRIIGQFVSREIKRHDWKFDPADKAQVAQVRWKTLIQSQGGDAAIVTSEGSL